MGITNNEGIIFDFAGPYAINKDHMAFGSPTRYDNTTLHALVQRVSHWLRLKL